MVCGLGIPLLLVLTCSTFLGNQLRAMELHKQHTVAYVLAENQRVPHTLRLVFCNESMACLGPGRHHIEPLSSTISIELHRVVARLCIVLRTFCWRQWTHDFFLGRGIVF